jgi:tyrosine-specific transport protein
MNTSKLLGGVLLVAGTAIGAGMLALPIATGLSGFLPSFVIFLLSWFFMTYTAFLILEVSLCLKEGNNIVSMAEKTLGQTGKYIASITYMLLLYALTTAYIDGLSLIFKEGILSMTGIDIPRWAAPLPVVMLFGSFVYVGIQSVDFLNRFLMTGLLIAFLAIITLVPSHIDANLYSHVSWCNSFVALTVVMTSFGYHVIIPSLSTYMHHDVKLLTKTLLIGSSIPLIVYLIWEFMVLGVVPLEGEYGIIATLEAGLPATEPLKNTIGSPIISFAARFFSFFCIITSFLGVSLSLSDFLADGLKIKNTYADRILISCLTFLPPLVLTLSGSRGFYIALEYAGVFVALLLGLLPIMMAWKGRYIQKIALPYRTPGGKGLMIAAALFFGSMLIVETLNKTGLLSTLLEKYTAL